MKHIWKIIKFTKELWPYYVAVSVFSIILALVGLVQPLFTGWLIDEIRGGAGSDIARVVVLVLAIFASDLAGTLFSNIGGFYGDQMGVKLNKLLGVKYYRHLLDLPQSYFDKELSGKLINRLNRSIQQVSSFMQMMSNNFLQFIFSTIFALAVVAYYSIPVALMLLSLYPIFIWLTVRTSGKWQKYQAKINKNFDISSGRFAEAISQIRVVKSFVQEKVELNFFKKHMNIAVDTTKPQSKYWHSRDVGRRSILNMIFLAVYMFIFVRAAQGAFTPGEAVTLILYASQIRIPIFTISFLVDNTQRAIADSKDYFEIMSIKPEITDQESARKMSVESGEIQFNKVNFSYDKKKVLNNISFTLQPGSKTALVGESGEGKTTITNLLMRLYEPQTGKISIDGQSVDLVTQKSLRDSIGVVFQESALFSGTIRENIAYSNPRASIETVKAAAKAANADGFISRFEKGYETEIGERGLKLSGGQKQRIAIARALLKDAPILILDEATSSLDSKSEAVVQEALNRLMKGRTTLIIAHRLSTITHVDQIITLSGGEINEIGSPVDLASSGGIYSQLLEMQSSPEKNLKKQLKKYEINA